MSTPRNMPTNSVILNTQNRTEFIDKFNQGKRNQQMLQLKNERIYQGRWDYLHDLNKLKQLKIEEQRQKVQNEREESIYSECTFTPKLNRSATYNHMSHISGTNNQDSELVNGLLGRQEAWNLKKHLKIEGLKQKKTIDDGDQCYFKPEVNPPNALTKYPLKSSTTKLIEDPESYTMFVARITNKRKADEERKERQRTLPGSGNIWSSKTKSYNLSYDYTKHEHSSRSIPRAGSSKNVRKRYSNNPNKQFSLNTINNDINDNQSLIKDKYYDYMYNASRDNQRRENNKIKSKEKIQISNQIDYDKAIEYLHYELYSFPLLKDEGLI